MEVEDDVSCDFGVVVHFNEEVSVCSKFKRSEGMKKERKAKKLFPVLQRLFQESRDMILVLTIALIFTIQIMEGMVSF